MKRGTPEHPKMLDLAEAIYARFESKGIPLPPEACETLACGTLERLHHYAARYAPAGDVGKHSNVRVAKAVGWDSDPEWIIGELCRLKWIDDNVPEVRLYVHDWHVHSDDYADRYLADNGLRYANGSPPRNKPRKNSPAATGGSPAPRTPDAREPHAPHAPPNPNPKSNPEPNPNPPPSPNPAARNGGDGGSVSWQGLRARLRKLGVSDADGALACAEANGCTPLEIVCILLVYETRPKCWSEGALHSRIKKAMPGEKPEDHWPPVSPEWKASKNKAADAAAKAELARLSALKRKEAEAEQAKNTALEETYGESLDAMPDDELNEIATPIINGNEYLAKLYRKSKAKTGLLRTQLLTAIAARLTNAR